MTPIQAYLTENLSCTQSYILYNYHRPTSRVTHASLLLQVGLLHIGLLHVGQHYYWPWDNIGPTYIYMSYSKPNTVNSVHTGMSWGQSFIPVWTGSGLDRVFAFGEEQYWTITRTIDMRVIIQDVSSVGLQMIGGWMQIDWYNKRYIF